jgi:hypothetical protein
MLLDCKIGGYFPNVCPIKLPNGCPNVNDGVCADAGYDQFAFAGLVYPKAVASASVGIP